MSSSFPVRKISISASSSSAEQHKRPGQIVVVSTPRSSAHNAPQRKNNTELSSLVAYQAQTKLSFRRTSTTNIKPLPVNSEVKVKSEPGVSGLRSGPDEPAQTPASGVTITRSSVAMTPETHGKVMTPGVRTVTPQTMHLSTTPNVKRIDLNAPSIGLTPPEKLLRSQNADNKRGNAAGKGYPLSDNRYSPYSVASLTHTLPRPSRLSSGAGGGRASTEVSKGLRKFSTKVLQKIKGKGVTKYNEVADELVEDYFNDLGEGMQPPTQEQRMYDQKNIRRRVYDAINVLMALGIIVKDKKDLRFVGLPAPSFEECQSLRDEKEEICNRIQQKMDTLKSMIVQQVCMRNLIRRNRQTVPQPYSTNVLHLPFVVVNTHKLTTVDCMISADRSEYQFNFDRPFEIHGDGEILKRLGFDLGLEKPLVDRSNLSRIKSCLPANVHEYVDNMIGGNIPVSRDDVIQYSKRRDGSPKPVDLPLDRHMKAAVEHFVVVDQTPGKRP